MASAGEQADRERDRLELTMVEMLELALLRMQNPQACMMEPSDPTAEAIASFITEEAMTSVALADLDVKDDWMGAMSAVKSMPDGELKSRVVPLMLRAGSALELMPGQQGRFFFVKKSSAKVRQLANAILLVIRGFGERAQPSTAVSEPTPAAQAVAQHSAAVSGTTPGPRTEMQPSATVSETTPTPHGAAQRSPALSETISASQAVTLRSCSFCDIRERVARAYKLCSLCVGDGKAHPKAYCGVPCQTDDWEMGHWEEHG
ncbi:uncharacterized protein LOC119104428 [Pollicipes pollicipes]|uniref:uncharacterized protein LOC119104428 n=1 Tax=Pollicipes pollicipes TaxID=41117 RepID=UPI001884B604|nr:uncharacterized protein LOC119104428 [Pollicipes pollicipes]XP_037084023.1 uncharacterized protein LOC119104428 [Pollicipes pollicipes]